MTKEEILQEFSDINQVYNNCMKYDTLKRMLDELTEPKTGHWINYKDEHQCSRCRETVIAEKNVWEEDPYDYCPNCGCRMV